MSKKENTDTIRITPTVGGKPMKARPFTKSKSNQRLNRSKDFKFDKKKLGGMSEGKIKKVMKGLKKASATHAGQARTLGTLVKGKMGGGMMKYKKGTTVKDVTGNKKGLGVVYKGKNRDYRMTIPVSPTPKKKKEGGKIMSDSYNGVGPLAPPDPNAPLRKRAIYGERSKQKKEERKNKIMKKAKGGSTEFGMLSVKAGIDKNPNPTQADRIAGAKMKTKKAAAGALMLGIAGEKMMKKNKKAMPLGVGAASIKADKVKKMLGKKEGGMMQEKSTRGYGAARTSGTGLSDEKLVPGKSMDYYKDLM
jgi:hypothetical protein